MEYILGDELAKSIEIELDKNIRFIIPTGMEIRQWLQITEGLPNIEYTHLTLAQQKWIVDDLFSSDYHDERFDVNPLLKKSTKRTYTYNPIKNDNLPKNNFKFSLNR